MTCASCASRVERSLNELDGVSATVNFATERATVELDRGSAEAARTWPGPSSRRATARCRRGRHWLRRGRRAPRRCSGASRCPPRSPSPVLCLSMIPALQFDGWEVGRTRPRDPGGPLGRVAVPPRGAGERPAWRGDDGHADLARRLRRLAVVRLRRAPRRLRGRLSRGRVWHHGRDPRRPIPRGARQAPSGRRGGRAARARRQGRRRARRGRHRAARRDRGASAPATASSSVRARRWRRTGSSRTGASAVDQSLLTGESMPVEKQPGDDVVGATRERRGPTGRPRHEGRRRHRARPDRPARGRGTVRQGPGAALGGPSLGRVRAGRDRARARDARGLADRGRATPPSRSAPPSPC